MSWLERPACNRVTSSPAALISSGSNEITVDGLLAPGWAPASSTLASPAASLGALLLSSRPWSVLMTSVALLISPSQ